MSKGVNEAMSITITIVNQKGGTGKTTLATNVARGLQLEGSRVLLVDSDPQGTARDWRQASEIDNMLSVVGVDRPLSLERDLPDIAQTFDWIVIDGAANLKNQALTVNAVKVADVVLIPVQPSAADIWGSSDLVELIQARQTVTEGKPQAAFVVSRQITGTRLSADVGGALADYRLPVFKGRTSQRIIYVEALSAGASVLDLDPHGLAAQEINTILEELGRFVP
jgi:chromosome partitioning protein